MSLTQALANAEASLKARTRGLGPLPEWNLSTRDRLDALYATRIGETNAVMAVQGSLGTLPDGRIAMIGETLGIAELKA